MRHSDILMRARAAALEAEENGFPNTAAALRRTIRTIIALDDVKFDSEVVETPITDCAIKWEKHKKAAQTSKTQFANEVFSNWSSSTYEPDSQPQPWGSQRYSC